ncbi:ABC transporter ATP-binding protein [Ohtaekwangia sp.]|uniref:ABC transporter ATP-binding protein n=1 Tax=Ohtaekwangia sp. TaxID=2066019 RepID=UPI002F95FEE7
MKPILEIKNISKKFLINHQQLPYLSFRDKLTNIFRTKDATEEFWALNDVSFDVQAGDSLGIIGRNGAGKSTLLKVLSRITPPTKGKIVVRGRVASLLEVGTGFHQELTGRENIFMNGSILGMKHAEIKARFDEIVDFSGTEKFLDTPLKHYSSGMQLRLAFAVAAHLEPEILIVDEVLAVGDAEFQKKCLKKMEDVTGEGRTVLFVSHNLPSLKAICKTGVLLRNGQVMYKGGMNEVIDEYTSYHLASGNITETIHYYQPHIQLHNITINGLETSSVIVEGDILHIAFDIEFRKRTPFELDVHLKKDEQHIISYANFVKNEVQVFNPGLYHMEYTVKLPQMRSGRYKLDLFFTEPFTSWFAVSENVIDIEVLNSEHHTFLNSPTLKWGSILVEGRFKKESL